MSFSRWKIDWNAVFCFALPKLVTEQQVLINSKTQGCQFRNSGVPFIQHVAKRTNNLTTAWLEGVFQIRKLHGVRWKIKCQLHKLSRWDFSRIVIVQTIISRFKAKIIASIPLIIIILQIEAKLLDKGIWRLQRLNKEFIWVSCKAKTVDILPNIVHFHSVVWKAKLAFCGKQCSGDNL